MKKSGFTIAEVLIALGIIGVVATFGIKASVQNDKGIRHVYSNTYYALDRAFYNAMLYPKNPNPFDENIAGRTGNGETISQDEGAKRLCKMLTEYINPVESNPCEASAAVGSRPARPDSSKRLISDVANDNEFTPDKVQFTAINGVRFFFSRRMPYANISDDSRTLKTGDTKFYLVFADINGTKFPNSLEYKVEADKNHRIRSKDPDIFAFAATDFGRMVPLGPPEFDGRYMLSRIMYFNVSNNANNRRNDNTVVYSKPSQPYYLMKAQAWGYYNNNGKIDDTYIIEDNPYSYNGYIKSKLNKDSRIYTYVKDYFSGSKVKKVPSSANIQTQRYGCTEGFDDECDIVIDRYVL